MDTFSKTIRFPPEAEVRLRRVSFSTRVPQNTLVTDAVMAWLNGPCPVCGAKVGEVHGEACGTAPGKQAIWKGHGMP